MAKVVLTPTAAEQLDALSNPIHARLLRLIVRLESWPEVSGAKPLAGNLAGSFRLRTGDYRLQFHVASDKVIGDTVIIDGIGHRDGFYEE